MEGLPYLPGHSFNDPSKNRFSVKQTLEFKNGYAVPKPVQMGIGGAPIYANQLSEADLEELANYTPSVTYGQAKQAAPSAFIPGHVALDKKVLRFYGYFKQTIYESPKETFRVRRVTIYYYLEDDSMCISEPAIENSGIPQGKLVKRQRLPKNENGDYFSWKDLNLRMNFSVYGVTYRICDCDKFTFDWMASEGMILNPPEPIPEDPHTAERKQVSEIKSYKTKSDFDKLKQFLELDRKVLRFYVMWDDSASLHGQMRPFILHFYLVDDTMEVREIHEANDGHDKFPVLIKRGRYPKNPDRIPGSFPTIAMELSESEVKQYFSPGDFKIGVTLVINGRKFIFYDCDNFTKAWYYQHFGITDFTPLVLKGGAAEVPKMEIPPHNGFGSLEDSLQNCLSLQPAPPHKNVIKQVANENLSLRYECVLDSVQPQDRQRRFILQYRLSDDLVQIYERAIRNSGFPNGTFLSKSRIAKPGSTPERPTYYGPEDFKIGATIEVFGSRFVIVNADIYVLKYMEEHSSLFSHELREHFKEHFRSQNPLHAKMLREEMHQIPIKREGTLEHQYEALKSQLRRLLIIDRQRVDHMFLKYNPDHRGYLSAKDIKEMCRKHMMPAFDEPINLLLERHGSNGTMSLDEFRTFMESQD